eukprot:12415507-Alexandrium_andersonii.AAC.1
MAAGQPVPGPVATGPVLAGLTLISRAYQVLLPQPLQSSANLSWPVLGLAAGARMFLDPGPLQCCRASG